MSEILELGLRLSKFIKSLGYYTFGGLLNTYVRIVLPSDKFATLIAKGYREIENPSYSPYKKTFMPIDPTIIVATNRFCWVLLVKQEVPLLLVTPCSDGVAKETESLASKIQEEFSGELKVVFLSAGEVTADTPFMVAYQKRQRAEAKKQLIEEKNSK